MDGIHIVVYNITTIRAAGQQLNIHCVPKNM